MIDDLAAVHEAGHVLVAIALGLDVARVQVGDAPRYNLVPGQPPRARDRACVLMAGGEAERVVFNREPVGDVDDKRRIADLLEQGDDEIGLRNGVRRLVELNAGTIRWLAAKLARRGSLTGDEVAAIVRGRPAV